MQLIHLTLAIAALFIPALSQDMREECVGCGDRLRFCEINCMHPTFRPDAELAWPFNKPKGLNDTLTCLDGCKNDYTACDETVAENTCLDCVQECTVDYEGSMLNCLTYMDHPTQTSTYDDTMDDCANAASLTMDTCSTTCYGADAYYGWSPAVEEGDTDESDYVKVPHYEVILQ